MVAFGTSGLRGLADDLRAGPCSIYARAFVEYLLSAGCISRNDTVLVGCDRRQSSPELTRQAIHAVRSAGLDPLYCGVVPTPALAYHALNNGVCAIMVTGSHIPADRNGLKFYRPDGEIDKDDEREITARAAAAGVEAARDDLPDLPAENTAATEHFIGRYNAAFPAGMLSGKRIGIYRHSSVAADVLTELVRAYGAEIVALGESNKFVAIDTEAIDIGTATRLADWSKRHELDCLVSTDGDGDRPLMTDETGTLIRGDALGVLASRFLKAALVATPVSSNPGIDERYGFEVVRTKIGSPYVLKAMAQAAKDGVEGILGFEANGGLLVGSPIDTGRIVLAPLPTRDSMLPILCGLAAAHSAAKPLSAVVGELNLPAYVSGRVENFPGGQSDRLMARLSGSDSDTQKFVAGLGVPRRVERIDGLQIFMEEGRMIHFRPSGNAPEMRCYASAPTPAAAATLLEEGLARLKRFLENDGVKP